MTDDLTQDGRTNGQVDETHKEEEEREEEEAYQKEENTFEADEGRLFMLETIHQILTIVIIGEEKFITTKCNIFLKKTIHPGNNEGYFLTFYRLND